MRTLGVKTIRSEFSKLGVKKDRSYLRRVGAKHSRSISKRKNSPEEQGGNPDNTAYSYGDTRNTR